MSQSPFFEPLDEFEPLADHDPGKQKGGGPPPGPPKTSGGAIASFVLGLLSILTCTSILTGIPAIIFGIMSMRTIDREPRKYTGRGLAIAGLTLGGVGCVVFPVMIALLLPAVQAAREAARRAQCTNNLKQIALALHNYHSAEGSLPPAYTLDDQGNPGLSWRVLILPYMDQGPLYSQFKLDEPWDSPANQALLSMIPGTYACPSNPDTGPVSGNTGYAVLSGPGSAFPGAESLDFADVADGVSNTLGVVETSQPVPWTKPQDLPFDASLPDAGLSAIGSRHPGGFNAAMLDGSIRFLREAGMNPGLLKALGTASGGEVVSAGNF
jgi:prepilin-type processing-associated H-X9-DG protein